jgi:hypothetical protein
MHFLLLLTLIAEPIISLVRWNDFRKTDDPDYRDSIGFLYEDRLLRRIKRSKIALFITAPFFLVLIIVCLFFLEKPGDPDFFYSLETIGLPILYCFAIAPWIVSLAESKNDLKRYYKTTEGKAWGQK